jgi:hypothetical protein
MKKNNFKKLRLSRETLQALTSSDAQQVVGGGPIPAGGFSTTSEAVCSACDTNTNC